MSILMYGCTTWTLAKCLEKKRLVENYARILRAVLNKSMKQHLTEQHQYCHLPPITKINQITQTGWTLLENYGRTHERRPPMGFYTWANQCRATRKDLHKSALCGYQVPFRAPIKRERERERERENLRYQHGLMMMKMMSLLPWFKFREE